MCDTMCVLPSWSADGVTYFAKNSDRSPNEPHLVIHVPEMRHAPGSSVQCTYIDIPQVECTREMVLFKPSWIWGAEMGINSSRVAIGNEAVFTRSKKMRFALTGMDMLRLALERSDSAESAIETLIFLLEKYGQGGNCGFDHPFFYDNSFLAADPSAAFVLETSGVNYTVMKIENKYAISNRLTIGKDHIKRGGAVKPNDDFSKKFTEPVYSMFAAGKARRQQVMEKLVKSAGASDLINVLRNHNPDLHDKVFSCGSVDSVCMHGGGMIGDHTTGSMAAALRPDKPVTLWCTGSSTPCISSFKPVFWLDSGFGAPVFEDPSNFSSEQSLEYWLKREHIHRAVIAGKIDAASLINKIRLMENEWRLRENEIMKDDKPDAAALRALSREASECEQRFIDELYTEQWQEIKTTGPYARYWNRKNKALVSRDIKSVQIS